MSDFFSFKGKHIQATIVVMFYNNKLILQQTSYICSMIAKSKERKADIDMLIHFSIYEHGMKPLSSHAHHSIYCNGHSNLLFIVPLRFTKKSVNSKNYLS